MPSRPTAGARGASLEIDGKAAGVLHSVKLPGIAVEQAVHGESSAEVRVVGPARPTEMQVAFESAGSDALLDWVRSALHGKLAERSGAVTLMDLRGRPIRRVEWKEGLLQELRMPTLDGQARKALFTLGLSWLPTSVAHAEPGVRGSAGIGSKPGVLLSSNFRVAGLPIKTSLLRCVVLPVVNFRRAAQEPGTSRFDDQIAKVEIGEVQFDFAASAAREVLEWVLKVTEGGQGSQDHGTDITVELLDARMERVAFAISLGGCLLRGYEEAPLLGGSASNTTVSLRFSIGSLDLTA